MWLNAEVRDSKVALHEHFLVFEGRDEYTHLRKKPVPSGA